jgi:hypothetical protein
MNTTINVDRQNKASLNTSASYRCTSSQAADGTVTVFDVVDTEKASWLVLSAKKPFHQPVFRR